MLIEAACLANAQTFVGGKAGLPSFFGEIPPLREMDEWMNGWMWFMNSPNYSFTICENLLNLLNLRSILQ
jgi:hypothetical protein